MSRESFSLPLLRMQLHEAIERGLAARITV
jgi:hypothetical protein